MDDKKDHYIGTMLEDMQSKFDLIIELISPLAGLPSQVAAMDIRLRKVEIDVDIIKRAVADHSMHIGSHKSRITKLEHS